jgi:hypothetical protein
MTAAITHGGQHGQDPDATATVRTSLVEQHPVRAHRCTATRRSRAPAIDPEPNAMTT